MKHTIINRGLKSAAEVFKTFTFYSVLLLISSFNVQAQEMWGINHSNFSGTMGIFLNPASIVAAPYKVDINLFAIDAFAQNNFFYSPAGDKLMIKSFKGDDTHDSQMQMNLYDSSPQKAFAHVLAVGPSMVYNSGKDVFGFHTAFRTEGSLLNLPQFLTQSAFQKYDYLYYRNLDLSMPHTTSAAMTWAELGFTYGRICLKKEKDFLKMAVNANILAGYDGAYVDIRKFDYARPDTNLLAIEKVDASYAHAFGTDKNGGIKPWTLQGIGFGTTVGFEYVHNRKPMAYGCTSQADNLRKYKYRVGASLIDIGKIHFDSKDATVVNLQNPAPVSWNNLNSVKVTGLSSLDTALVHHIGGTAGKAPFNIWLPMAFSAQFDYSFTPHVYGNLSVVNRLRFFGNEIARPNQTCLSFRYERRTFETSVNVNLYEYSKPSLGAAIRVGRVFIGTDRLGQWVSWADLNSLDLYFGVKFNFCQIVKKKNTNGCPAFKPS